MKELSSEVSETNLGYIAFNLNMTEIENAVNEALKEAREVYQKEKDQGGLGFAKIQGLDGRKKEARYLKDRDEFRVSSNTSQHVASANGTTVSILGFSSQSIQRKRKAYKKFIDVMKRHGFFQDDKRISVYTRAD